MRPKNLPILHRLSCGIVIFDLLCSTIMATLVIGAVVRIVVALSEGTSISVRNARLFHSVVHVAHTYQREQLASSKISSTPHLFDRESAHIGRFHLPKNSAIEVVTFKVSLHSKKSNESGISATSAYVQLL